MNEIVDPLARQRIEDHMASCDKRQEENGKRLETLEKNMTTGFDDARNAQQRLHGRIDKILWAVLLGLAGVLGQIAMRVLGH